MNGNGLIFFISLYTHKQVSLLLMPWVAPCGGRGIINEVAPNGELGWNRRIDYRFLIMNC